MNVEELKKLKLPFEVENIEWRVQKSGMLASGQKWGQVLAYVTNRGVMDRLDDVVGAENWKNEYSPAPDGGILCGISIKIGDEWVTKYDGADNTLIEATKGGLSNAMKRSAVQWGIGRYLYGLDMEFVTLMDKKPFEMKGHNIAYSKELGKTYYKIPTLPAWAMPKEKNNE